MPSTTLLGMSIPVTGDDLTARLEEYGSACFLVTVGADGSPKVVHVPVLWDGEVLRCTPGAGTLRNLGDGGSATLVFPAPVERRRGCRQRRWRGASPPGTCHSG